MKIERVSAVLLLVACFSSLPDDADSLHSDVEADEVGKRAHIVASEERTARETFIRPAYEETLIRTGPGKRAAQKSERPLIILEKRSDYKLHSSEFAARASEENYSPNKNYLRSSDHGKPVERKFDDSDIEKRTSIIVKHLAYLYNPYYRYVDIGKRAPQRQKIPLRRLLTGPGKRTPQGIPLNRIFVGPGKRTPQKEEVPLIVIGQRTKGELYSSDLSAPAPREKYYPYYPIPGHRKRGESKRYDSNIDKRISREIDDRSAYRPHDLHYSSVDPQKRDGNGSVVSKSGCIPPDFEENEFNLQNDPGALRIHDSIINSIPCTWRVLLQDWNKIRRSAIEHGKHDDVKRSFRTLSEYLTR